MAEAGLLRAGVADHGGTAVTAEGFSGEQEIHGTLFHMTGCFLFHTLSLLKDGSLYDGGHPVRHADGSPNIHTGVSFV